jgi:uncharacterized protein (TIGR04141 family)
VSFGHECQRIEDGWLELDFGRRVALNSIPPDKVLEIRAEQVFARWHLASERAPKASALMEFGVELDRDLVSTIEGLSSVAELGKLVRGSASLRLAIDLGDLLPVLSKAKERFESEDYKKHWPEIDNLSMVKDHATLNALDAELDKDFLTGTATKAIVLFTPNQRRGENTVVDSYIFGRKSKGAATSPFLTFAEWANYASTNKLQLDVAAARSTPVHFLDEAKEEISAGSVYDCFGYELTLTGKTYVLSSGIWFEAVDDFVRRINKAVLGIPEPAQKLTAWDGKSSEGDYNRTQQSAKVLHFDAKNIHHGGGQSKFEFCDLMHIDSKTLYFVKIASKASGMSHLVEQVRRTVELVFGTDDAFRKKLITAMKKHYPNDDRTWLLSRPKPENFNICLVSMGRSKTNLPFFPKCALARLQKDLLERGHNMSFLDV